MTHEKVLKRLQGLISIQNYLKRVGVDSAMDPSMDEFDALKVRKGDALLGFLNEDFWRELF